MSTEGIVKVSDKVVPIFVIEGHEGTTHYDELNLVHVVPYLLQLLHSVPSLDVRVVASTYRPHRSGLIASVRLRGVLKV